MYQFRISETVKKNLLNANKISTSIESRLSDLSANPMSKAIPTNISIIGDFYVNAGRYCILFDVNEEQQIVEINSVVLSAYLHKIITGKISP
jgi:hypothetical protein